MAATCSLSRTMPAPIVTAPPRPPHKLAGVVARGRSLRSFGSRKRSPERLTHIRHDPSGTTVDARRRTPLPDVVGAQNLRIRESAERGDLASKRRRGDPLTLANGN